MSILFFKPGLHRCDKNSCEKNKNLPSLIGLDQSGFLRGRFIGQNITTVFDIIHFTEIEYIPAIFIYLFMDLEKTFDKMEPSFIHKCLEIIIFIFCKENGLKYTDIVSCVTNNGFHSDYFKLSKGVRQGCPLSPYLFLICAEFQTEDVRQNNKIRVST